MAVVIRAVPPEILAEPMPPKASQYWAGNRETTNEPERLNQNGSNTLRNENNAKKRR